MNTVNVGDVIEVEVSDFDGYELWQTAIVCSVVTGAFNWKFAPGNGLMCRAPRGGHKLGYVMTAEAGIRWRHATANIS